MGRGCDIDVLFVAEHPKDIYSLYFESLCFYGNHHLLHKGTSLVRSERDSNVCVRDMNLEGILILCPF